MAIQEYFEPGSSTTAAQNGFEPPKQSRYIELRIGADWLPTEIKISRNWKEAFDATQYGESIMNAYRHSIFERATQLIESGGKGTQSLPSLRQIIPTLLRTQRYDEYQQTLQRLMGNATYTAHGQGWNEFDEPAMTVEASRSGLTSIAIDPGWARSANAFTIAHDVVDCCNQIRSMRPVLETYKYLEKESDDQLAERLVDHVNKLLRNDI